MKYYHLRFTLISALFFSTFWQPCFAQTVADNANGGTTKLGVEGFHDAYREGDPGVNENSNYGSLTGAYNYKIDDYFASLDGRASYGKDDYNSPSGTLSGIPQWEFELRGRVGMIFWNESGTQLQGYVGVGERYFDDKNKGGITNLGYYGYERRISQPYIPIGATFIASVGDGWTISPTAEFDALIGGNVNSRLGNGGKLCFPAQGSFPGGCTASGVYPNNAQPTGFGLRGDVMFTQNLGGSTSWEIGPFVRYWDINQSSTVSYPLSVPGYQAIVYEPPNTRVQAGVKLSLLW